MKRYKCVLKKVEETNYKKGIIRTDESGGGYRAARNLYVISFIWFMIFQTLYLVSNITYYFGHPGFKHIINMPLLITAGIVFFMMIGALVAIRFKAQLITFGLTLVGGVAEMTVLADVEELKFQTIERSIIATKYFWFHHAPIILMIFFSLILLGIGIVRRVNLKKDYNKAIASMFAKYSEEHPDSSDAEWRAHLEELDKEIIAEEEAKKEAEKAKKAEKKRKK